MNPGIFVFVLLKQLHEVSVAWNYDFLEWYNNLLVRWSDIGADFWTEKG